jgi:hypothetical protein
VQPACLAQRRFKQAAALARDLQNLGFRLAVSTFQGAPQAPQAALRAAPAVTHARRPRARQTGEVASGAGQQHDAVAGQAGVGRELDVSLDHGAVDPRRARAKRGLRGRPRDHLACQRVHRVGSQAQAQLAQRGLLRDAAEQADQAEAPQVQRVRHLAHEHLIAPPRPRLEHHQPHERRHRRRRAALGHRERPALSVHPPPQLPDRRVHAGIAEQRVDRLQVLGQRPHTSPPRQQSLQEAPLLRRRHPQHRTTRIHMIVISRHFLSPTGQQEGFSGGTT